MMMLCYGRKGILCPARYCRKSAILLVYRFRRADGHAKGERLYLYAEAYDAATGMLNLRARQYEPTMNRFSQKDIVRGQTISPLSLSRYAYCGNNPIMHIDPSGEYVLDSIGNWWGR